MDCYTQNNNNLGSIPRLDYATGHPAMSYLSMKIIILRGESMGYYEIYRELERLIDSEEKETIEKIDSKKV